MVVQAYTTTTWQQLYRTNMKPPTPETYKQWYNDRKLRTASVIQRQSRITGRQIKDENLSARMIYDAGYTYNEVTDTMERNNG